MKNYNQILEKLQREAIAESFLYEQENERNQGLVLDPNTVEEDLSILHNMTDSYRYKWLWFFLSVIITGIMIIIIYFSVSKYLAFQTEEVFINPSNIDKINGYWQDGSILLHFDGNEFQQLNVKYNLNESGFLGIDLEKHILTFNYDNYPSQNYETAKVSNDGKTMLLTLGTIKHMDISQFKRISENDFNNALVIMSNNLNTDKLYSLTPDPDLSIIQYSYKEGYYLVGKDIPAGDYIVRTSGVSGFAALYSDDSYNFTSLYTSRNIFNNSYFRLKDGDYLEISPNTYMFPVDQAGPVILEYYSLGTYKVGFDIPPGTYEVVANGEGRWYKNEAPVSSTYYVNSDSETFIDSTYVTLKEGEFITLDQSATIKINEQ